MRMRRCGGVALVNGPEIAAGCGSDLVSRASGCPIFSSSPYCARTSSSMIMRMLPIVSNVIYVRISLRTSCL
jgi:hypothetical protein